MRPTLLLALLAVPTFAQTVYSWEDKDGLHYTDDPTRIPRGAKSVVATVGSGDTRPTAAASQRSDAGQPGAAAAVSATSTAPDERLWRERFVTAHRRIETLKGEIASLQANLPPRTECVPQPLVPVGTVQVGPQAGAPVMTGPGAQVVTVNGITAVNQGTVFAAAAQCQVNPLHDQVVLQIGQRQVALRDAQVDLEYLDRLASQAAVPREWRRGW